MEYEIEIGEEIVTLEIDFELEGIVGDDGRLFWIVSDWWIERVDGKKVDTARSDEIRELLDAEEIENKILEQEGA